MRFAKQKHISRIDSGGTHTWWVRFLKGTGADQHNWKSRSFPDGRYKNKTEAYRAAVAYRDKVLSDNPEISDSTSPARARHHLTYKSSTSGVVGVRKIIRDGHRPAYGASWSESDETGGRVWKKTQFGYDDGDFEGEGRAFKLAVRKRKQMIKMHYVGVVG